MLSYLWSFFSSGQQTKTSEISPSLQGTLYIKQINKPFQKLAEECSISLSIIDEKNYNYVLNITNEDDANWKTLSFALNVDSNFCKFVNSSGTQCIMWLKNETFYILELFSDETIVKNEPIFFDVLSTLISSNDFQIPISEAKKENTKEQYVANFDVIENLDEFLKQNFKNLKIKTEEKKLVNEMNNLSLQQMNKKDFSSKYNIYKEIFSIQGIAMIYKIEKEVFIKINDNYSYLKIIDIGDFNFLLVLEDNEKILVQTKLCNKNSVIVDEYLFNVSFLTYENKVFSAYKFNLKEKSIKDIKAVKNIISKCLYESNTKTKYNNLSKQVQELIDYDGIFDIEDKKEEDTNIKNSVLKFKNFSVIDSDKNEIKNKLMTQAFKFDKAFLIKENNSIDVINLEEGNNSYNKTTSFIPFKKNDNVQISEAKMFSGDNQILFKDKINEDTLWQYDLNKESIVQEWKCGDNGAKLIDFTHSKKLGQLSPYCDIYGINKNKIFSMDGRVNRPNKIVEDKIYSPSSTKDFTCIATPEFEAFATGAKDGNIRLYNDITKNAKTLIPCFGDPIISIDITKNGDYLLVTCEKYLMLINTRGEHDENAFTVSLKRAKRKPITLKMTPEDVVNRQLGDDNYTPAKFDINKTTNETIITSSLGPYIIVWNLEQVKKGIVNSYQLKNVNEYVIGNTTKFNKNKLIVTMPNKVLLQDEEIEEI